MVKDCQSLARILWGEVKRDRHFVRQRLPNAPFILLNMQLFP